MSWEWDCCDHLFCSGGVVCINRAEFSGVVWIVGWSVLVGLGLRRGWCVLTVVDRSYVTVMYFV